MNDLSTLQLWLRTVALLAGECLVIVTLCGLLERWVKSARGRRALWHTCLLSLAVATFLEITGAGRAGLARLKPLAVPAQVAIENASISSNDGLKLSEEFRSAVQARLKAGSKTPMAESVPVSTPSIVESDRHGWQSLWPGALWVLGVAVIGSRILCSKVLLVLVSRRWRCLRTGGVVDETSRLAKSLCWSKPIRLLESPVLAAPMAFGVFRPTIALPASFEKSFDPSVRAAALVHELAHLIARDPLWYLLADAVTAMLWWHPLVWWARRRLHLASEMAADGYSAMLPEGPELLAECLFQLGQQQVTRRSVAGLGIDGSRFHSHLGQRVQRLLQLRKDSSPLKPFWPSLIFRFVAPGIISLLVLAGSAWAIPSLQQKPKKETVMQTMHRNWKQSALALTLLATLGSAEAADTPRPAANNSSVRTAGAAPAAGLTGTASPAQVGNVPAALPGAGGSPTAVASPSGGASPGGVIGVATAGLPAINPVNAGNPTASINQKRTTANTRPDRRKALESKLESIVLEEVISENLPLGEVVHMLIKESAKRDPDQIGVNFLFAKPVFAASAIDPATGLPLTQVEAFDLTAVTVHIIPALKNVRLTDVLDAIVKTADREVNYTIEEYGVVFTARPLGSSLPATLEVATFRVNPDSFFDSLADVFGIEKPANPDGIAGKFSQETQTTMLRAFLRELGIKLDPPKTVFFNDRLGILLVRVADYESTLVHAAIETLGGEYLQRGDGSLSKEPARSKIPGGGVRN